MDVSDRPRGAQCLLSALLSAINLLRLGHSSDDLLRGPHEVARSLVRITRRNRETSAYWAQPTAALPR